MCAIFCRTLGNPAFPLDSYRRQTIGTVAIQLGAPSAWACVTLLDWNNPPVRRAVLSVILPIAVPRVWDIISRYRDPDDDDIYRNPSTPSEAGWFRAWSRNDLSQTRVRPIDICQIAEGAARGEARENLSYMLGNTRYDWFYTLNAAHEEQRQLLINAFPRERTDA